MEKWKSVAFDIASSLKDLKVDPSPKTLAAASPSYHSHAISFRRKKPRSLLSLCIGVLGRHFEDIIADLEEIASEFPSDVKLAMLAVARRRRLLNDDVLIALAENSWDLLDISGSDVSDGGLSKVAEMCTNLRAVDISWCDKITAGGVSALLFHCRSLEILRCGGSPKSNYTARGCLNMLKPKLSDVGEESWEELDSLEISSGASSVRWLVWPMIDEDSRTSLATECPRIIVNPQPSAIGFHGSLRVPTEALVSVALDHSVVEAFDIDPKTWAVSGAAPTPSLPSVSCDDGREMTMAEKFRLAFVERDERLAPKRAKNARQHRRRAEKNWLMNSSDAKAVVLASQASKFLRNKS